MAITDFTKPTPIVADYLGRLSPGDALDIGAGNGRNTLYLAGLGWSVDALDTDASAVDYINKLALQKDLGAVASLQDFTKYDTPKKYNAIVCLMTLHFMSPHEVTLAIEWIKNHTKPGGIVTISGFNIHNPKGTRPYLFGTGELRRLFADWSISHYDDNDTSSVIDAKTQVVRTYHVTRIVAQKPSNN